MELVDKSSLGTDIHRTGTRTGIGAAGEEFDSLLDTLQRKMVDSYLAVNSERNPVSANLEQLSEQQLKYVTAQYAEFPNQIVSFLMKGVDAALEARWEEIADELRVNIGEERGEDTEEKITHYLQLKSGLASELDLDIEEYEIQRATILFVSEMQNYLTNEQWCPASVIGAIYACECSAIPELEIVQATLNRLSQLQTGTELDRTGPLASFLDKHLAHWEVGHEEGLRTTCREEIVTPEMRHAFSLGFNKVMEIMDRWWEGLYKEATSLK